MNYLSALQQLHLHDACLIPVNVKSQQARDAHTGTYEIPKEDKAPFGEFRHGWHYKSISWTDIEEHVSDRDGLAGLVPKSVGLVCLDWDRGADVNAFTRRFMPLSKCRSGRPGRFHLWYPARGAPKRGTTWVYKDAGGEYLVSNYVILYQVNTPALVWEAVQDPRQLRFPDGLIGILQTPGKSAHGEVGSDDLTAVEDLSHVRIGERNISLFNAVRAWAYKEPRPATIGDWVRMVQAKAVTLASKIPDRTGFDSDEVAQVAYSIATYTWGYVASAPDPEKQRQRGIRSGKQRRRKTWFRDKKILRLHKQGISYSSIAAEVGVSRRTAIRVVQRDG